MKYSAASWKARTAVLCIHRSLFMATRSQRAVWMDAVIRALRVDFAKDTEITFVAMSSIARRAYSGTICANFMIL
jgi:hypothetical protein